MKEETKITPKDSQKNGAARGLLDTLVIPSAPADLDIGDYVFACRWSDADWNDPWAVGYVHEIGKSFVTLSTEKGELIPGVGFRGFQHALRVTRLQADKIIEQYKPREGEDFVCEIISEILTEV